jgi:hypothetical protein
MVLGIAPPVLAGTWLVLLAILRWLNTPEGIPVRGFACCAAVVGGAVILGLLFAPWKRESEAHHAGQIPIKIDISQW